MGAADAAFRVLEAAYVAEPNEQRWLDEIVGAMARFDLGPWVGYTANGAQFANFSGEFAVDLDAIRGIGHVVPEPILRAGHAPAPTLDTAQRRWRRVTKAFGLTFARFEEMQGYAVPPVTGLLACDARGDGVFLGMTGTPKIAPRTRRALADVAAHVAASYRLRTALAKSSSRPDAIFSASGTVLDASPCAAPMRASLALAVRNLDRARGKLRRLDPEAAVASWKAMVEARWTLVDHVESDGKRHILAHCNEQPSIVGRLRAREAQVATLAACGHSDKYIAYELGLARSTVAAHLRRALVTLRLHNRHALILAFGPLSPQSPHSNRNTPDDA